MISPLYKATTRFHFAVCLFSNRSQKMSKSGKNISDTLACSSYATFLILPHFDVICDVLVNRHTAKWNPFVQWICKPSKGNGKKIHIEKCTLLSLFECSIIESKKG